MICDGEEAIQTLKTASPDASLHDGLPPSLVVLDVNLPKKSGLEILAWIRETPSLNDVPVFMLSSSDRDEDVTRAFELRTDSYYVKPKELSELQNVVEGMLGFWYSRTHRRLPGSAIDPQTV